MFYGSNLADSSAQMSVSLVSHRYLLSIHLCRNGSSSITNKSEGEDRELYHLQKKFYPDRVSKTTKRRTKRSTR